MIKKLVFWLALLCPGIVWAQTPNFISPSNAPVGTFATLGALEALYPSPPTGVTAYIVGTGTVQWNGSAWVGIATGGLGSIAANSFLSNNTGSPAVPIANTALPSGTTTAAGGTVLGSTDSGTFTGKTVSGPGIAATPSVSQVNIIYDDDCGSDGDCNYTLSALHHWIDLGQVNVLAYLANSGNNYSAPIFQIYENYWNHTGVPIGTYLGSNVVSGNTSTWTSGLTTQFDAGDSYLNYSNCVTVYRQALANAAVSSVVMVSTGFLGCMAGLMQSSGDGISSLTGSQLIQAKVTAMYLLGGDYPTGAEFNMQSDPVDANYVFAHWTSQNGYPPIYLNGYTPGSTLSVGRNALFTNADPSIYVQGLSVSASRPGWDILSVYQAIFGRSAFTVSANGTNTVNASTGANSWSSGTASGHYYLTLTNAASYYNALLDGVSYAGANWWQPTTTAGTLSAAGALQCASMIRGCQTTGLFPFGSTTFKQNGSANVPVTIQGNLYNANLVDITNSVSDPYVPLASLWGSGLTSGQQVNFNIGRDASQNDVFAIGFTYQSFDSTTNHLDFGYWGNPDAMSLYADGGLTLGAPTGGDKGAGTLNTAGLYVNGASALGGNGALQLVNCTNGSTGSADAALLAAAATAVTAAGGGTISVNGPCTVNAPTTIGSHTLVNLNGNVMTAAAAAHWSGSAIAQAFICADSATDITWENGYYVWTGAAVSVKVIACNGEVDSVSYSHLSFLNNTFVFPGDGIALVHVTGAKVIGNYFYQPAVAASAGAEVDAWDNDFDVEEANNTFFVTNQGIGSIVTGFAATNAAENIRNFNIHNNYYELISSTNGYATAMYNQGYEGGACSAGTTDTSQNIYADNVIVVDAGVNSIPFRADYCSSNLRVTGNIIVGDGSTVASHPAIEVNGGTNMGVDVTIDNNKCVNFLAGAASGADGGIFTDKGAQGVITNNKGFGCGTLANLVGTYNVQSTTVIAGNTVGGDNVYHHTTPLSVDGTLEGAGALAFLAAANPIAASSLTSEPTAAPTPDAGNVPYTLLQGAIPMVVAGSGYIDATGNYIVGQAPSSSATCAFDQTTGAGATMTCSAATLVGSASDNGRVMTILDTTYKYFTITTGVSTTVATGTITGTLSSTAATVTGVAITGTGGQFSCTCSGLVVGDKLTISGTYGGTGSITGYSNPTTYYVSATNGTSTFTLETLAIGAIVTTAGTPTGLTYTPGGNNFANSALWLSGETASNTVSFAVPLRIAYANVYLYTTAAGPVGSAGFYYATCSSITICTLYNNKYSSGTPTVPASPTAFSGLTPAAFTQSTSIQIALSGTVGANLLGNNGSIGFDFDVTQSNDNNAKTATIEYNTLGCAIAPTTTFTSRYKGDIAEAGTNASQICILNQLNAAASQNLQNGTISDTTSHAATINLTLANQYSDSGGGALPSTFASRYQLRLPSMLWLLRPLLWLL